jgi:hypothetical protein
MKVWPPYIPFDFLFEGFTPTKEDNRLKFQPDVGPLIMRRNSSARVDKLHAQMFLWDNELNALNDFYTNTLEDGALTFSMFHPMYGVVWAMQFIAPPDAIPVSAKQGRRRWKVDFQLNFLYRVPPSELVLALQDNVFTQDMLVVPGFSFLMYDTAYAVDNLQREFGRPNVSDIPGTSDFTNLHPKPAKFDVAAIDDQINFFNTDKVLSDIGIAMDILSVILSRPDMVDSVTTTEAFITDVESTRTDTFGTSDLLTAYTERPLTVGVAAIDDINQFIVHKVFADASATMETLSKVIYKPDLASVIEASTSSDSMTKEVNKPDLADSFTHSDLAQLHPQRPLSDFVTLSDNLEAVLLAGKVLKDSAVAVVVGLTTNTEKSSTSEVLPIVEVVAKVLSRPNVVNSTLLQDILKVHLNRVLKDFPECSDTIDSFNIQTVLKDFPVTTEVVAKGFNRPNVTDTFNTSDIMFYTLITGSVNRAINGSPFNRTTFN